MNLYIIQARGLINEALDALSRKGHYHLSQSSQAFLIAKGFADAVCQSSNGKAKIQRNFLQRFSTYWRSVRFALAKYRTDVFSTKRDERSESTFVQRERSDISPVQTELVSGQYGKYPIPWAGNKEISDRLWTNQITGFPYSDRSLHQSCNKLLWRGWRRQDVVNYKFSQWQHLTVDPEGRWWKNFINQASGVWSKHISIYEHYFT